MQLFTDDCVLYWEIRNQNDHNKLQEDLESLEKCNIINLKKKSHHFYNLNNHIQKQVSSNPYLRLQNQDLKWREQINNVCNKANSTLGFLQRNLQHYQRECLKTAFIVLVRFIMEYSTIIWVRYTQTEINKLESIQRKGACFITKNYKSRDVGCLTKMLKDLELPT